jgi:hypothetical protein
MGGAWLVAIALVWAPLDAAFQAAQVDADQALRERLLSLPRATGHSEIRRDYDPARDETRVWIDTNEDDLRLWSRRGGQLDAELRVAAVVHGRAAAPPEVITVECASLGELRPASRDDRVTLAADGLEIRIHARAEPAARSGDLLFLSTRVTLAFGPFLRLVTAERVNGQIWGHEFVLQPSQLELLRAFAIALVRAD